MARMRLVTSAVVIDTSCLVALFHLDLLPKLVVRYNTVHVPRYVWKEASRRKKTRHQLQRMRRDYEQLIKRCTVSDEIAVQLLYDRRSNPGARIDRGEAEAIIQAREVGASEVLIDERMARQIALRHSLNVRGVLGVLKEFKRIGVIEEVKPLIEKLKADLDFRIDEKLLKQELSEIGES